MHLENLLRAFLPLSGLNHASLCPEPPRIWARVREIQAAVQGQIDVDGHTLVITVGVDHDFPYALPHLHVALPEALKGQRFPHFEMDGGVCYIVRDGTVVDPTRPLQVLEHSLNHGIKQITQILTHPNPEDFLDEFTAYWNESQFRRMDRISSFIQVEDQPKVILGWHKGELLKKPNGVLSTRHLQEARFKRGPINCVADQPDTLDRFHYQKVKPAGGTALYVPLQASVNLKPPLPGQSWSAETFRNLVRQHADLQVLDPLLKRRPGKTDLILLGVPRSLKTNRRFVVGVRATHMNRGHVLGPDSDLAFVRLEPMVVNRYDQDFVLERGGSNLNMKDQKILVIGCGSVGGHLVTMLAQAGFTHLTLVDHDLLTSSNTYRHVLGLKGLGKPKVEALKNDLESRFPYLHIQTFTRSYPEVLQTVQLHDFHLIIQATGDPNTAFRLNHDHRPKDRKLPPVLHTWLEPLGIGGHTLVVLPEQQGCYACLYVGSAFQNKYAFAAQGQEFLKDTVGCGSYYAPFADLDARRTAELTVRTALNVLQGKVDESTLFSWKGDGSDFKAAGYRLTSFHNQTAEDLARGRSVMQPRCKTCQ